VCVCSDYNLAIIFIFAVLELWLIQLRQIVNSFFYVMSAVLLKLLKTVLEIFTPNSVSRCIQTINKTVII